MFKTKKLGKFTVESGTIRVSDPCYSKSLEDKSLTKVITKCKTGKWNASINIYNAGQWGTRVSELYAISADYMNPVNGAVLNWKEIGNGAVDSGQMGIFDEKYFNDESIVKAKDLRFNYCDKSASKAIVSICDSFINEAGEKWYSMCCGKTLGVQNKPGKYKSNEIIDNYGGIIPYGCVSSSGFGDGCYPISIAKDTKGNVVAIMIEFINI